MSYLPLYTTKPLPIIDHPADSKHFGGLRLAPRIIVLHATGGTNSVDWLSTTSPLTNPVSVHRLIAKVGQITKIVPDDANAWGAGYGIIGADIGPGSGQTDLNAIALQIELENLNDGVDPYPQDQTRACAAQIVEWWGKYGFLPVLGHAQVDGRKTDPLGFDWNFLWLCVWHRIPAPFAP